MNIYDVVLMITAIDFVPTILNNAPRIFLVHLTQFSEFNFFNGIALAGKYVSITHRNLENMIENDLPRNKLTSCKLMFKHSLN